MRKERSLQNITIIVLAVAILAMSIGFAAYEQTLNINGTATFTAAKWDVRFDTASFDESASTIKATTKTINDTSVSYTVTLPEPGSSYSFKINAKNYGTINAKLVGITLSGLTSAQQEYITYTVNYAGTDYTASATGLNVPLNAGENSTALITVTVNYVYPAEATSLPQTDQEVNLTAAFAYQDARNN